jgi:type II secretory ATPase GspE/PulE/Tfp pilus assembly ATPase PilB-like protein
VQDFNDIVEAYGPDYFDRTGVDYTPELTLYKPKGCPACNNSGFKGRMGVHELLVGTDDVKRAVQRRAPIDELRKIAQDQGMRTLLQDSLEKMFNGIVDYKQARAIAVK